MSRFIDEEYDGICIKIPRFLIEINNLNPLLEEVSNKLKEQVKLSCFLPDFQNSIYELENYKEKLDIISKKRKEAEDLKKQRENIIKEYLSFDKIPFVYKQKELSIDWRDRDLYFKGESISIIDFYTDSGKNISLSKVKTLSKDIHNYINESFENFLEFANQNGLYPYFNDCKKDKNIFLKKYRLVEDPIFVNSYLFFSLRIEEVTPCLYETFKTYRYGVVDLHNKIIYNNKVKLNLNDYYIDFKQNLFIKQSTE